MVPAEILLRRACLAASLLLLASCATPRGVPGRTILQPPARALSGPIVGLTPRAVADNRDFTYAVELSAAPSALAWSHLGTGSYRLGLWSLDPEPAARADVRLNNVEFDVEALAFSPDGSRVAAASRDGTLRLFDAADGRLVASAKAEEPLSALAWSPDGLHIVAGSARGLLVVFDAATCSAGPSLRAHQDEVRALAFDDSGALWSGSWDKSAASFELRAAEGGPASLEEKARLEFPHFINDLTLSRDGAHLGVAFGREKAERSFLIYQREKKGIVEPLREGNSAAIVDARSGAVLRRLVVHHGIVASAAISPDGQSIASGGWDGRLLLFSGESEAPVAEERFGWTVRRVRFSRDGRYLAVGAWTPQKASQTAESDPAAVVFDVRYPAEASAQ